MKKLFIILGIVLMVAVMFIYQQKLINFAFKLTGRKQEPPIKAIAVLDDLNKNVTYKRSFNTNWGIGEKDLGLAVLDAVSTSAYSSATIKFNIGHIFNLNENSLVVIEEPKQPLPNLTEVNFHQGSFEASNEGIIDAVLVVKSNKIVTEIKGKFAFGMAVDKITKKAKVWVKTGQAKVTDEKGHQVIINENESKDFSTEEIEEPKPEVIPEPEPTPPPAPEPIKKPKTKTLSTNEIRKIISKQRQKIDTCYARRRKVGGGRVTIALSIKNTGNVSNANIASSTFSDPVLENCVVFWMKAVKFPKFGGTPVKDNVDIIFR